MALDEAIPVLAAVIICRNEERWIESTVRSVLAAVSPFPETEIVIVDSCSEDETVERARRQGARVLILRSTAPRSPALGRLVGERATRSRYVFFVDGDTEVEAAWLEAAVAYLDARPGVAGVAGKLREIYFEGQRVVGEVPDCFHSGPRAEEVDQLGGNALYRRAALEAVGSFNPYVVSYEEAELAERLRLAGYTVVRLPIRLGTHRTGRPGSLAELRRRRRENLIKGYGQALRLGLRNGTFAVHARRMARYLQFIGGVVVGTGALLASAVTGEWRVAAGAGIAAGLLLIVFMVRSRSVVRPLRLLLDWSFWAGPLVRGLLEKPKDPRALDLADLVEVDLPAALATARRRETRALSC